jgi:pimeloyl-ACP methyl ester carboxylesterase
VLRLAGRGVEPGQAGLHALGRLAMGIVAPLYAWEAVAGWSVIRRVGHLRSCGDRERIRYRRPGATQMPSVPVNGTELYYEIRGTGPPVLLIMGATGDGGHFDALADVLADEFKVVTYDRRGNGRSPAPACWQTTSPEEQADDAAALLNALGTGPAAVFGTSSGGNFALCLMIRHPGRVRGAILHEPGLYALVDDFRAVRAPVRALVQEAMEAGGPPAAVERFWCYVAGDDGWNRLAPALRERLRATASTLFGVELGTYELYLPDDEALAAIAAPVRLLVSQDGLPFFAEIAGRFGKRLGADVATTPGTHATYHEHPYELAEVVRPFLRQVSGVRI